MKKTKNQKNKRNRKTRQALLWVFGALAILIVVAVLIVVLNWQEPISDDYFVSDDTKIVLSMDDEMASFETGDYEPGITRIVYYHDGEKITNVKIFYEYENEDLAREAYNNISVDYFATSKRLNGKYIVMQAKTETFDGLTVEEMEDQVESMRAAGALLAE